MTKPPDDEDSNNRIVAVTLDEESIGRSGPDIEHERAIAIYDLVEQNLFAPEGVAGPGPYTLHIAITGNRLMFDIRKEDGSPVVAHLLSLTPFRRVVKDYFMICDSYYNAIRTATPIATCSVIAERLTSSATAVAISTPRFIGPGCMTMASGFAAASFSASRP